MSTETKLICRANLKKYALQCAEQRAHKFDRVSDDFFVKAEANLRNFTQAYVRNLPSVGKTIK